MPRIALKGLAWITLSALACADAGPERVAFAPWQAELFAAGGALTDAWADFDGDGDPDRFVGFDGEPARLYRNDLLNGFEDVAPAVGLAVRQSVRTAAWGDYDADGDPDLLLGFAGDGPVTALYRNDGGTAFVDVAEAVGLLLPSGTTRQGSWIDADEDGDLDLFLAMRDGPNRLFENGGAAGFRDVTDGSGLGDPRRTVGALWLDTGDGGLDLLVANMNGDANELYRRSGDAFVPWDDAAPLRSGGRSLGDESEGSVRPCVTDFDVDGDFDVFFANYGPNALFEHRADDEPRFENVAADVGLAEPSRYDTCAWADFDHDGRPDLFVNGTVGGGVHYRDWLLRREAGEPFVDVTPPELATLNASHGATWVDFDLDGDLDLALAGVADDGTHALLQNLLRPEAASRSLQVRVLDGRGRATRPGAEVRLFAAGTDILLGTGLVDTGSGYDSQSDLPVHFGLRITDPVDVEVTILAGGRRVPARVDAVAPGEFRGRVLELWVSDDGTVRRPGG